jgi:MFS family permease
MAVVAYAVGTISALSVLGRLSNHLGRRLTAITSLSLLLLGCLLLLNVHDIDALLVGRLLVGLGTGLPGSSQTSYIIDAAPSRPEWLASVASSQGSMLGLSVGAIASGALVQFGPWPRDLIYLVCIGFLLLSAALIAISPETATPTPGAWRAVTQGRRTGPGQASAPCRCGGVPGHFGERVLLPSIRACASRRSTPHPQPTHPQTGVRHLYDPQRSRRSHRRPAHIRGSPTHRIGMITFLAGMIGASTAIAAGTLVLFIIATIVAGAGQGIAISAATRGLLHGSTLAERVPIFSAIYLLCYSGAAFPSLISSAFSLPQIALGYGGLAVVATLFTVLGASNPHPDTTGNSTCDSSNATGSPIQGTVS